MQSDRTEIVDFSGEKFSNITIPCWVIMIIIPVVAVFDGILMIAYPDSPYAIVLSLFLISIFILYYSSIAKGSPGKLRKFSISDEEIEFFLPHKPQFIVYWKEFEKVEITLKKLELKPFCAYIFQFSGNNSEKKVTISLLDFHKEKVDEIIQALKKYATLMKKSFSAVKETNVSGVYIVEELP